MDTPNWRQILGGTAGVALLGSIGYFGQARIRTGPVPQKLSSDVRKTSTPDVASTPAKNKAVEPTSPSKVTAPTPSRKIKVDITGEIEKPGVYEIAEGQRVEDLIKLAGGIKSSADRNGINYAMKLRDEAKVVVPSKESPKSKKVKSGVTYPPAATKSEAPSDDEFPSHSLSRGQSTKHSFKSSKQAPSSPIMINSASEVELQSIPGVGPSMAKRIIEYRSTNGKFSRIEDLQLVKGMGGKVFDKIRPWITL